MLRAALLVEVRSRLSAFRQAYAWAGLVPELPYENGCEAGSIFQRFDYMTEEQKAEFDDEML